MQGKSTQIYSRQMMQAHNSRSTVKMTVERGRREAMGSICNAKGLCDKDEAHTLCQKAWRSDREIYYIEVIHEAWNLNT